MSAISSFFNAFSDLIFPRPCAACSRPLLRMEDHLCISCIKDLPYTRSEDLSDSPIEQLFWGKLNLEAASAMWHFQKGGKVQNILHRIKYRGDRKLAKHVGRLMANRIKASERFNSCDLVVPVPLHRSKLRKRGFNQSELIADALAESLGIELRTDLLVRQSATETQTKKNRIERWRNVGEVFTVTNPEDLNGRTVLLIDDVITTGATLEACALPLSEHQASGLSVYAAAVA